MENVLTFQTQTLALILSNMILTVIFSLVIVAAALHIIFRYVNSSWPWSERKQLTAVLALIILCNAAWLVKYSAATYLRSQCYALGNVCTESQLKTGALVLTISTSFFFLGAALS
jgi:uncharacterized membrane protein (UPF0182 family)